MKRLFYIISLFLLMVVLSNAPSDATFRSATVGGIGCTYTCTGTNDLDSEEPELFEFADGNACVGSEFIFNECTSDCINTFSTGWRGPSRDCVGGHSLAAVLDTDLGDNGEYIADWSGSYSGEMYLGWSFKISALFPADSDRIDMMEIMNDSESNYQGWARLSDAAGVATNLHAYGNGTQSSDYWSISADTEYRAVLRFDQDATVPNTLGELYLYDSSGNAIATDNPGNGTVYSIDFSTRNVVAERARTTWEDYNSTTARTLYIDAVVLSTTLAGAKWIP
jgi:hypothetical protein